MTTSGTGRGRTGGPDRPDASEPDVTGRPQPGGRPGRRRGPDESAGGHLAVCSVGGHGGPAQSLLDILPYARPRRRVVVGFWSPVTRQRLADEGLAEEIVNMPRPKGWRAFVAAWHVRRLIRRVRPEVVHANGLTEIAVVALAAIGLRSAMPHRIVVWVHNWQMPRLTRFARRWIRSLRTDLVWCAVSPLARDLVTSEGLAAAVTIVPNPISRGVVADTRPGASSGPVRIGFLGTDHAFKGFDLLGEVIEATSHLPVEWLLFTNKRSGSPAWRQIEDAQARGGVEVDIRGRVQRAADAYGDCDLVFVPSRHESFCRVAAEAMLNGIPVVASDLDPLRALLGESGAGLLFPTEDTRAAGECIARLVEDRELAGRMGECGRTHAARFACDRVGGEFSRIYFDTILEQRPRAD